jgi:hypothetical protein
MLIHVYHVTGGKPVVAILRTGKTPAGRLRPSSRTSPGASGATGRPRASPGAATTTQTSPLARCEFATLRVRLIKIGARVIAHAARIRVDLPTSCPERSVFAQLAASFVVAAPS